MAVPVPWAEIVADLAGVALSAIAGEGISMTARFLTESERQFIANSLCVAAMTYRADANILRPQNPTLAEGFDRQAAEAEGLCDLIEQAESVEVKFS